MRDSALEEQSHMPTALHLRLLYRSRNAPDAALTEATGGCRYEVL
jgi:hypothetical protein